jgi:quercetin dioxygenase-like cupin family protein
MQFNLHERVIQMKDSFRFACCPFVSSMLIGLLILSVAVFLVVPEGTSQGDEQEAKAVQQDLTLTKFGEIEVQEYPWGWIRWTMNAKLDGNSKMTFGVVYIKPNQTNPLHLHPQADEILHVVEGSCEHRMGDKWVKLQPGDTIRIPKGIAHNARTLDEACRVVVVYDTGERKMVPVD